ncbi:phosphatase PAP2 family protein [Tersicoccus sp. MR15.9]|uniref:phosphatase PAP2 family protein n=1 Tax=Tersicoccus mangrovi TaxID=3121635 RepID=UPI002FE5281C
MTHDNRGWWRRKFAPDVRTVGRGERRLLLRSSVVLALVGAVVFATMLVGVLTHTGVQRLDLPVESWFDAQRDPGRTGVMDVVATVFGPVGMPIVVAVVSITWAFLARHAWRPVVLACGMLLGVASAELLAPVVRHPRPPVRLMLLGPDHTFSFPSGHVMGASDFFLIGALLVASRTHRQWVTVVLFVVAAVAMAVQVVSRLYLGYHWLTDTLASVGLSLMITALAITVDTHLTARVRDIAREGHESGEPETVATD